MKFKNDKLLKNKRNRFCLYIVIATIGILCIVLAIICKFNLSESIKEVFYDALLSFGGGFITSSVMAFLVNLISFHHEELNKLNVRNYALYGIPFAIEHLMRIVIEKSIYKFKENTIIDFKETYKVSIQGLKGYFFNNNDDGFVNSNYTKILLENMSYSFSILRRDIPNIINNRNMFIKDEFFTENEINVLTSMLDEIKRIENTCIISDMGEYLELFINLTLNIKEINDTTLYKIKFIKNNVFEKVDAMEENSNTKD